MGGASEIDTRRAAGKHKGTSGAPRDISGSPYSPESLQEANTVKLSTGLSAALLLSVLTTGCVYVDGELVHDDDWKATQDKNRSAISELNMGMSRDQVIAKLGAPADSEAFTQDGEEVRVLFYRTRHAHSDGETTRDETTPLVFRSDKLVGWGDAVYQSLR